MQIIAHQCMRLISKGHKRVERRCRGKEKGQKQWIEWPVKRKRAKEGEVRQAPLVQK